MTKRVVIVEDEPNIIEAINFILSRDGWDVTVHANGETAVAAVRTARPDVILLDVMLPGRSGYDILKDLRADPDFAALPVLMLTARGQKKDRELADSLGVTRFMTKPFSNAELLAALGEIAAGA
ncbi:response regulator transcription factor [Sinisalibacter lacisalsi]|uniref:Response regulator n=1 Tax=Sinisalibacter lacisalsi TaxID=1526570 RepID=A0ABQ1QVE3_9RHOB|nr:response regulator [Sinisalibacter lacisalsi]GGD44152.1 response regulator [Sinisalibacter lacisalsi]